MTKWPRLKLHDMRTTGNSLRGWGRPEAHVRKNCSSRFSPQSPRNYRYSKRARTCCEGPFAEVLRATGPMAKSNPFRFSTKYQDDETGLLYFGYRYYNASMGRWPSRDPIGEIQRPKARAENVYSFCGNDGVDYWDYLGLWLGSDHRSLTSKSFSSAWNGLGDASPCSGKKLLSVISDANVATDTKQPYASDLKQHYNRGIAEFSDVARDAYVSHVQSVVVEYSKLLEGKPDRGKCLEALQKLGRVSHSWQDYYAHAIGLNSPYWGDPGPIDGNPDSPSANLKPASWGGYNNWGEHGPSEPASREADMGLNRYVKAESFVTGKYPKMLQAWLAKCRCHCGGDWP